MACQTFTSAVNKLIHSLCLEDYPCGGGRWNKSSQRESEGLDDKSGRLALEEEKDEEDEDVDVLLDLLRSPLSPWQEETDWSPQALVLRETAVKTPETLKENFIYSFFKTLRVVDKRVSLVDEGLLKFGCLEELVLSANNITEVPSENLPKTLRVLELYGNQISSLKSLNTPHPPPHLQHLGLGNNCLGSPEDLQYFTADLWPQLMSLDLSWSEFTEQYVLVETLSKLPHLQSLALEGNPLTLSPFYPGFVLDSLSTLLYLDGNRVTSDQRHHFSGLAQLRGRLCEEAEVTVCVKKMRGVPCPASPLEEFPVVNYSYLISYEFLHQTHSQENNPREQQRAASVTCPSADLQKTNEDQNQGSSSVVMNSTVKHEWAEVMEFNYTRTHHISDLKALKNFLLRGLWLSVEEEKVLSWPAPPAESAGNKASADKKAKESSDLGQKIKEKKKKKEAVLNLIQEEPTKQTLGSVHLDLRDLLQGKDQIRVQCDLGVLTSEQNIRTSVTHEKEQSKKQREEKKEDKKTKASGETTNAQRNVASSKGKGKGRREEETEALAGEGVSELESLTVELSVELCRVSSVSLLSQLKIK